jgi:hypothetical protein
MPGLYFFTLVDCLLEFFLYIDAEMVVHINGKFNNLIEVLNLLHIIPKTLASYSKHTCATPNKTVCVTIMF